MPVFHIRQLKLDFLLDILLELADGQTHLLHGVAIANGYAVVCGRVLVSNGLKIDGDAKRCANLVLTAITLTDRAGLVIIDHKVLGKLIVNLACLVTQLLGKRQNSRLEGCKRRMQMQNGANVILCLVNYFLVVSVNKECKRYAVGAQRGFDNVRNVVLTGLLIEVGHILAAVLLMLTEVIIGTVGNAPKLAPSEWEQELEVGSRLGVEAKLVRIVITQTKVLVSHTEIQKELVAIIFPISKPFEVGAGLAEEFQLHLLKFAGTEYKVTGRDLVAEGFTDLCNTERQLFARGTLCCGEVYKNPLCSLGTQIYGVGIILGTL